MTLSLFLAPAPLPPVGGTFRLEGDEGRHAATVQRIRTGEEVLVADGAGSGVRARVTASAKGHLDLCLLYTSDAADE